jgi:hypothetical protein
MDESNKILQHLTFLNRESRTLVAPITFVQRVSNTVCTDCSDIDLLADGYT